MMMGGLSLVAPGRIMLADMPRGVRLPDNVFPSRAQLDQARAAFEELEPRDVFYRAAIELVELGLAGDGRVSTAEALALLLKTWNFNFYRFKRVTFNEQHFQDIEALLQRHDHALRGYRQRGIEHFSDATECDSIVMLFDDFTG